MARKSLKDQMAENFKESLAVHGGLDDQMQLDIQVPNDVSNVGSETRTAPTQKPSRPRALTIAYNPNTKVVYIVFRTNHWHQYNDVSTDVWLGLKNSPSTNDYLPTLEDACSSHGPAQLINLSAGTLARISDTAASASKIQKGKLTNWKAADLFKE